MPELDDVRGYPPRTERQSRTDEIYYNSCNDLHGKNFENYLHYKSYNLAR